MLAGVDRVADGGLGVVDLGVLAEVAGGLRRRRDERVLARLHVLPRDEAHMVDGVDGAPVGGIDLRGEAVAFCHPGVVHVQDAAVLSRVARPHPDAVVLQTANNPVRVAHVDADLVVLANRHVVEAEHALAVVDGEVGALVGGHVADPAVVGRDPQVVVVAPPAPPAIDPGLAAIPGDPELATHRVNPVRVERIDRHLAVIDRPHHGTQRPRPGFPGVAGDVDAATRVRVPGSEIVVERDVILGLDGGHDDARVGAVNLDVDHAGLGRQAAAELAPGGTAVGALEHASLPAARHHRRRLSQPVIEAGVQRLRVVRSHDDLGAAGPAVLRKTTRQLLPGGASIGGLEQAAFTRVSP